MSPSTARIITLLEESDERVIIVSPYMKISKWYKLIQKINELKTRGIRTEIYVRDDPDNTSTYRDLDHLTLQFEKIPNLHSKLYMNERYGIVTSMNLLLSSEINSLEIGYVTETRAEYKDLLQFYHKYIRSREPIHSVIIAGQAAAEDEEIMQNIRNGLIKTGKHPWLWLADNELHICTGGNNYDISIDKGYLRITARLNIAFKEVQHSKLFIIKAGDLTAMKLDMCPGSQPDLLKLTGQGQQPLESTCINGILKAESAYLMESVIRFIDITDNLVFQEARNSS